jgi:hypothetical protein
MAGPHVRLQEQASFCFGSDLILDAEMLRENIGPGGAVRPD